MISISVESKLKLIKDLQLNQYMSRIGHSTMTWPTNRANHLFLFRDKEITRCNAILDDRPIVSRTPGPRSFCFAIYPTYKKKELISNSSSRLIRAQSSQRVCGLCPAIPVLYPRQHRDLKNHEPRSMRTPGDFFESFLSHLFLEDTPTVYGNSG